MRPSKHLTYAYSLIEMLVVIGVLVAFLALAVRPMRELTGTVPRTNKMFRTWSVTTKALDQLKQDVEYCGQIEQIGLNEVRLVRDGDEIQYSFSRGLIVRRDISAGNTRQWQLEDVSVNSVVWKDSNGETHAVVIQTYSQRIDPAVKDQSQQKTQPKLRQDFVYFKKGHLQ